MSKVVYFMRPVGMVGPIKIGCTKWELNRLVELARWSPFPLEMIVSAGGDHKLEAFIHRKLAASRSHQEWFNVTDELLTAIEAIKNGMSIADAFGAQQKAILKGWHRGKIRYLPKAGVTA